jgi:hypothetical protein
MLGKEPAGADGAAPPPKPKSDALAASGESSTRKEPGSADADAKSEAKTLDSKTLAALLTEGKLGELAKALDVDAKAVDTSDARLALIRRRSGALTKKELAIANRETKAAKAEADLRATYLDPHKATAAYGKGDFHAAAEYMAKIFGDDFATITRNIAKATSGMDPKELERYRKDRELTAREKALEAKVKESERSVTEQQRRSKSEQVIAAKCDGHPALALKGGAALILATLEAAWDPDTKTVGLGYRQAADQVLAAFDANAKALGYAKDGLRLQPAPAATQETPRRGKQEFPQPAGEDAGKPGETRRRGMSFEERAARAARISERSRL